jgi:hypothetical protein
MSTRRFALKRRPAAIIGAVFAAIVVFGTTQPWAHVWGSPADGVDFDRGILTAVIALGAIALCVARALNGDRGAVYGAVGLALAGLLIWLQVWFLLDVQDALDPKGRVGYQGFGSPSQGLYISMAGTAGFTATMIYELVRGVRLPQRLLHRTHAAGV